MKGLKELDEPTLSERCGRWLTALEMKTMLKRRDQIVEHYEKLLKKNGNKITYQ
jgi:hypothetical protein